MIWNEEISFDGFQKKIDEWYKDKDFELCDPPISAQFALDLIFKTLVDDREDYPYIQNGIRGIQQGICDSTYALNNTMQSGFNGMNVGMLQGFNGVQQAINADTVAGMQNTNALQSQLANCCCETREAIQGINYNLATNTCALQNTMNNNTRDLLENQNSNTRAILDFLTNDKIATLQAENSDLNWWSIQDVRESGL